MNHCPKPASGTFPEYVAPKALILPFETEQVLCESPLPGGNEGIGFENWN